MSGMGRRALRGLPLLAPLVLIAIAIVLAVLGHWRRAAAAMAAASGLALVLRLVLPDRRVGPLAVRSRRFDVLFLLALTTLLTAAALAMLSE